jgi:hypothetical protein
MVRIPEFQYSFSGGKVELDRQNVALISPAASQEGAIPP